MSNIDKRALRVLATALDGDDWHAEGNSVYGGRYDVGDNVCYDHIASCESVNAESPHADFIASANPATVLALLDELEAAHELVELQRFKLERQAEDLHQAKSLESIHREKRSEVEREYSDYKHRAESNSMRLAKEVCFLEDALKAAGIRINGED